MTPWDSQHSHIWAKLDHSSTMLHFEDSSPNVVLPWPRPSVTSAAGWCPLCEPCCVATPVTNPWSTTAALSIVRVPRAWNPGWFMTASLYHGPWFKLRGDQVAMARDENPRNGNFSPGKQFRIVQSLHELKQFLLQAESKPRWWFQKRVYFISFLYSWRKENNLNEHIFLNGWLNYQLDKVYQPCISPQKTSLLLPDNWSEQIPMRISCSSPRRRLGWYPPLKTSKDLSENGWFLQKESRFWGACSVAMVCWYTRYTKEISKNVNVWWHHAFCWCKSRYRFISFCLEEVCSFLEIQSHCLKCRNIWKT